jgi:hypothetical protein
MIEKIKKVLTEKIIEQICADLTTGKTDNDQEEWSVEKISKFVHENYNNINNLIEKMISVYEKDDDLNELLEPAFDWIREYLYYYVKCLPDVNYDYEEDYNILNIDN